MAETKSTGTTGKTTAASDARSAPRDLAFKSPAGNGAQASVPAFGGNRGGKPRADGLVPGSPEAKKADQDKDAQRKRDARAGKNMAEPPPLPSVDTSKVNPTAPLAGNPIPGAGSPPPVQSDAVPWDPTTLRPLLQEIIDGAEKVRIETRKCQAVSVGLPQKLVEESAKLATYPVAAKSALTMTAANGTCKLMNGLNISGKYSDAAIAFTALTAIIVSNRRSDQKFEEMIAEFKKSKEPEKIKP